MKATVFETLEKIIQIPFVADEFENGAVCFANDEEVRADFKLQFTAFDVVNYVYGILFKLYLKENIENASILNLKIPFPADADFFWKYSDFGKKLRQEKIIETIECNAVNQFNWEFME
ncbi:type ISP restriction/modification enzyme [Flavobacterium seoulense]|uniref:Type ISP restriction-modification enzyme LLaBIII C-terminal specificity domain-containing protein n=1 Tax=Flavobacterium seoulense TaxID=1492738 RepID=A0A066WSQ2_9FLAO|nr:type ISP restriction/modification enzyme [Flavobacterium seoulense]KDN55608.1 hypothetical protein FEM21_12100 [Flavobacterium seoulense]